jgi:putative nucleotidyltransferase with HDIG domain
LRTFFLRLAPPRTLAIPAYLATLLAGAGATIYLLVAEGYRIESPWAVGTLCAIAAVAERGRVRLNSTTELSISLLPMLFAAVAFGPLEAMIVGAASMLGGFRAPYMKWAVFTLSEAITGAGTALAAGLAASLASESIGTIAAATLVGAFAAQLLDAVFASMTLYLRGTGRVRDYSHTVLPVIVASVPLYTPVVAVLVIAYQDVSPWTLPLFLTPALAAQRLFAMYQEQRRLAEDLSTANEALEEANLSFAAALVATLDARDQYTAGHSAAVAIYSRDIAARMGLSEAAQQEAHLAGLVHDIGKIGLPPGLLEKEGPLTLEERRVMQQHSEIGEGILAKVATYDRIAAIVRHHHERVDGHGYPDGLPEAEIPSISRIIAVADAYNAMTSDRPYREAMPSRVARMRLAQAVGSQFDTSVVAAFEAILATADESYRLGMRSDFDFSGQRAVAVEEIHAEIAGVA